MSKETKKMYTQKDKRLQDERVDMNCNKVLKAGELLKMKSRGELPSQKD